MVRVGTLIICMSRQNALLLPGCCTCFTSTVAVFLRNTRKKRDRRRSVYTNLDTETTLNLIIIGEKKNPSLHEHAGSTAVLLLCLPWRHCHSLKASRRAS